MHPISNSSTVDKYIQEAISAKTTIKGYLGKLMESEASYKTKRLLSLETILGAGDTVKINLYKKIFVGKFLFLKFGLNF